MGSLREALALHHDHIGTEHLLLGVMRQEHSVPATLLFQLGIQADAVRTQIKRLPARPGQTSALDPVSAGADQADHCAHVAIFHHDDLPNHLAEPLKAASIRPSAPLNSAPALAVGEPLPHDSSLAAIMESDVVLVLIGPHWLKAVCASNGRPTDPASMAARAELEAAQLSKLLVPVLLDDIAMPSPGELPANLAAQLQADPIRFDSGGPSDYLDAMVHLYWAASHPGARFPCARTLPRRPTVRLDLSGRSRPAPTANVPDGTV